MTSLREEDGRTLPRDSELRFHCASSYNNSGDLCGLSRGLAARVVFLHEFFITTERTGPEGRSTTRAPLRRVWSSFLAMKAAGAPPPVPSVPPPPHLALNAAATCALG
ncbi:hypothetical protein Bbelb_177130 [Branchiostoma belcheri]|nr:hypothetical protein Bbelb_177130 [Branchiostoma belcheri]